MPGPEVGKRRPESSALGRDAREEGRGGTPGGEPQVRRRGQKGP